MADVAGPAALAGHALRLAFRTILAPGSGRTFALGLASTLALVRWTIAAWFDRVAVSVRDFEFPLQQKCIAREIVRRHVQLGYSKDLREQAGAYLEYDLRATSDKKDSRRQHYEFFLSPNEYSSYGLNYEQMFR